MTPDPGDRPSVHPAVERAAAYAWRLLVIGLAFAALFWLLGQLRLVVLALAAATLFARVLAPPTAWLTRRGLPRAPATGIVLLSSLALAVAVGWATAPAFVRGFEDLPDTLGDAIDDLETWLVEDAPFDVTRDDVRDFRSELGDRIESLARSSTDTIVSGAMVVVELIAGLILAIVLAFFLVKDGPGIGRQLLARAPGDARWERMARRAWDVLGGYLLGAALLGVVESITIGTALALVGGDVVLPVMALTFVAAFVPFLGAIVAGIIAVFVALATTGVAGAVIVAIVAIVVQQLDNDLLAPIIYGRAVQLQPLVVLLAITVGGTLFGIAGAFLAVPVTAVVVGVWGEWNGGDQIPGSDGASSAPPASSGT
jgi:predicted PurR-regulated permease PerM